MTKKHPPLDPESMNRDRAEWAASCIRHFQCQTGADWDDAVCDLLCDLTHFCDREGFDFYEELVRAQRHYAAETAVTELVATLEVQAEAAQAVIDAWEQGDLAGAVRMLDASLADAHAAIAKAKGGAS